jgi:hypothetical protein
MAEYLPEEIVQQLLNRVDRMPRENRKQMEAYIKHLNMFGVVGFCNTDPRKKVLHWLRKVIELFEICKVEYLISWSEESGRVWTKSIEPAIRNQFLKHGTGINS